MQRPGGARHQSMSGDGAPARGPSPSRSGSRHRRRRRRPYAQPARPPRRVSTSLIHSKAAIMGATSSLRLRGLRDSATSCCGAVTREDAPLGSRGSAPLSRWTPPPRCRLHTWPGLPAGRSRTGSSSPAPPSRPPRQPRSWARRPEPVKLLFLPSRLQAGGRGHDPLAIHVESADYAAHLKQRSKPRVARLRGPRRAARTRPAPAGGDSRRCG